MATKPEVRFAEVDQVPETSAVGLEAVDGSEGKALSEDELTMEEGEEGMETQIPLPPIKKPAVISCHLILNLIDDAITMLRTLGIVTEDLVLCEDPPVGDDGEPAGASDDPIYPAIEALGENLDEALVEKLKYHADRKKLWKELVETDPEDKVAKTTTMLITSAWLLCCHFITHEYARDQLEQTGIKQPPDFLYMCELLGKIRLLAMRRFSTSLEEVEAIEGYRMEIFRRDERAIRENDTMDRNHKADRQKRADDLAQYLKNERLIQQDKENSVLQAKQLEDQLKADCASLEAQETTVFNAENSTLSTENTKMDEGLFELQNKDRDKELQMRGKKGQSIEEVADLLWEYEDDITNKTQKLNALVVEHKEIAERLTKMEEYFAQKARLAAIKAEEERLYREANVAKRRSKWLPYYAAKRIQRYWGRFKQRKIDAEKAANKGKGKKGKGGGKKKGGKKKKK